MSTGEIARAAALPSLAIAGSYNFWADQFNFRKRNWQDYYSVNLVLTVPLLNGFQVHSQVGQSKALLKEIEWNRKGLAETVKLEVQQALLNLQLYLLYHHKQGKDIREPSGYQ
jgi:outer membrane protein TolC